MIEFVKIKNYKSIKDLELQLNQVNILIGCNGAGKTNFISFFGFVQAILNQRLGQYTLERGGMATLLYQGRKASDHIDGFIDFDHVNAFAFTVRPDNQNKAYIEELADFYNRVKGKEKNYDSWDCMYWDRSVPESTLLDQKAPRAQYVKERISSFTVYHFHDTSDQSPMRQACHINDNESLKYNGANLAAYLYKLSICDSKSFKLIEATIRSIAPYFKRFKLRPDPISPNMIQLEWEEVDSDMYLNASSFSDGTLRFIALATLLLQSELPRTIIIDEPELGLHPAAITKFAALVKRASQKSQMIISTQSVNVLNCFEAQDIITVDREGKSSVFRKLSDRDLTVWLDDYNYSLGELWEKNVIGGQL